MVFFHRPLSLSLYRATLSQPSSHRPFLNRIMNEKLKTTPFYYQRPTLQDPSPPFPESFFLDVVDVSELSTSKVIYRFCECFDEDLHPNDHEGLRANKKKKKKKLLDADLRPNFHGEEHIITLELQEFSHY